MFRILYRMRNIAQGRRFGTGRIHPAAGPGYVAQIENVRTMEAHGWQTPHTSTTGGRCSGAEVGAHSRSRRRTGARSDRHARTRA
jgi:hypothetical protein